LCVFTLCVLWIVRPIFEGRVYGTASIGLVYITTPHCPEDGHKSTKMQQHRSITATAGQSAGPTCTTKQSLQSASDRSISVAEVGIPGPSVGHVNDFTAVTEPCTSVLWTSVLQPLCHCMLYFVRLQRVAYYVVCMCLRFLDAAGGSII